MGGPGQDLTGYTETDTLLREVQWASYWLNRITGEFKAMREAVISCRNALRDVTDNNIHDKANAVRMMLSGAIKEFNDEYIEDGHNLLDTIGPASAELKAVGERKMPIPVKKPLEIDAGDTKVDPYDVKMFEQTIGEFLRCRELLQKLMSKYYSTCNPVVQLRLDIVNQRGESIQATEMNPVPIINAYMMRKAQEKMDSGQVVGLNGNLDRPSVPDHLPDDKTEGSSEIPPPEAPPSEPAAAADTGGDA